MMPENRLKKFLGLFALCCTIALCVGCFEDSFIKADVEGPLVSDPLIGSTSVGKVNQGKFTEEGWTPEQYGSITYNLPGMTQGFISFDVKGLNRAGKTGVIFTMIEPSQWGEYADPYVLFNPYRVTLTLKSYEESPQSTFDFLWTIKQFPGATAPLDHYVEGIPENADGYQETVSTGNVPVYPEETTHIQVKWSLGKSELWVNGNVVAEHSYRPLLYNPSTTRVIIGHSPGMGPLEIDGLVFSNVEISFPKL